MDIAAVIVGLALVGLALIVGWSLGLAYGYTTAIDDAQEQLQRLEDALAEHKGETNGS